MFKLWQIKFKVISKEKIAQAVNLLKEQANPLRIILFGSYGRGEPKEGSDLDFLVVEKEVSNRREEMVRLVDALRPLRLLTDIVVVSEKIFQEWSDTPGNLIYYAVREGKVVYEMEGASKGAD